MNEENNDFELSEEGLDDSVVAEEHQGDAIKRLRGKLKEVEAKAKEHLDNWQRAQAEFVNVRKRDEEAKQDFLKFAQAKLIEDLLPVVDALASAVAHGDKGIEATLNLMLKVLKNNGVEEVNPIGEKFDPSLHEAVSMKRAESEEEDQKILDVLQKGYILQSKIIRPAKVIVGEFSN